MHPPVIIVFDVKSPHARAVYKALHGRVPKREGPYYCEVGQIDCCTVVDTVRELREHCGIGGVAVSNLLETPSDDPAWWLLFFNDTDINLNGCDDQGRLMLHARAYCKRLPFDLCTPCRRTKHGKHLLRMPLGNGTSAVVCGRTTKETVNAGVLARLAATRCLPSAPPIRPKTVDLPLRDDDLILIIQTIYGDAPQVIAEAVMALRKLPGRHDGGLLALLNNRRDLQPLARAVQSVLTGDPSMPDAD
jgi:hypothetical protein